MQRRLLILAALAAAVFFVVWQSQEIILSYYLFSVIWILPLYYFLKERAYVFLSLSAVGVCLGHAWFFRTDPHLRMLALWAVEALLLAGFAYYRWELNHFQSRVLDAKETVRKNLESFQAKYQTRLNSLHHLELQVGSLMNLFEIARDFSECMDFNTLAEFLMKKLRTELAFQRMEIFLLPAPPLTQEDAVIKIHAMSPEDVRVEERPLSPEERGDFAKLLATKAMVHREQAWYFPIMEGSELCAVFAIHGIREEDLARVEVLSAYLVLLIKKIRLYETVRELAIVDELTQVFMRRHFFDRLEEELRRSIRFKLPLTVLMLDIDHFKRYNDDFGHLVGDATLKEVADLLKRNLRRVDLVGRYGGEEFIVVMPETRVGNAAEVAERIRSNIARHDFQLYNVRTKVTVSQGIAVFDGESVTAEEVSDLKMIAMELVRKADESMYRAKEEGRNRVCIHRDMKAS